VFSLTELGSRLRLARKEKNLSLDEVQNITKIQKKYLLGIEEGNYEVMPGKFYARAFIKQYAEAVGLEPEELFEEYKSEIPLAYEDDIPEKLSRVQSRGNISGSGSKILEAFPKIIFAIFFVAMLVLIWFLVTNYLGGKEKPITSDNKQGVNIKESGDVTPSAVQENDDADDKEIEQDEPIEEAVEQEIALVGEAGNLITYMLSNTDTFELQISAAPSGETWVNVKDSANKGLFTGMLKNGASETFDLTNETEVFITAGRLVDTEIIVNDEVLEHNSTKPGRQDFKIQFEKKE
jgi:cytoskeletal protein RodZ